MGAFAVPEGEWERIRNAVQRGHLTGSHQLEEEVAAKLQRLRQNKTKITWHSYYLVGWSKAWELNKKWSDGKEAPCP
ncbi:MAG TPA: hypothetical protein VGJ93_10965 [Desulfuromonadaceae bacterium]|jgi:hypothetical protein